MKIGDSMRRAIARRTVGSWYVEYKWIDGREVGRLRYVPDAVPDDSTLGVSPPPPTPKPR